MNCRADFSEYISIIFRLVYRSAAHLLFVSVFIEIKSVLGCELFYFGIVRFACRSEEHTSELQSRENLVCRLLLEKKKMAKNVRSHCRRNRIAKHRIRI